jgi:endoglucanase
MRRHAACGAVLVAAFVLAGSSAAGSSRAPHNRALPKASGLTLAGKTLSARRGRWTNHPTTFRYAWQSCNAVGRSCRAVSGARRAKFTLRARDVGHRMRVVVVAINRAGRGAARSKPTAPVTAANQAGPPPPQPPPPGGPPPPPAFSGLHVSGNKLLNGTGQPVHLHGVNRSGTEYSCIQGYGIFDGPSDDASIAAIASWHANIVHIGLNEDCILGINGVDPAYAGANYMGEIVAFVNRLHAHNLYAEVSLMWAAAGSQQADDHPPILDQDHSPAAWTAIANAFKTDPNTILGLQSEPHDISWACWKNGGASCSVGYSALGMQSALSTIRATGATNVVTASGIDWANNLQQWLTNRPTDPLNQLMAEQHVYGGNTCYTVACLNQYTAPVAAQVPVVFGEFGESYDASSCATTNTQAMVNWADSHGVNYEAWTWDTWGNCLSLISNFNGTPNGAYGNWIRSHYQQLPPP